MTRIKICGCMKIADAVVAAEAGADFVGIMFATNSRRRVSSEEAALIVRAVGTPLREMEQDDPPPLHPGQFDTIDAWFAHGAEALDRLLARKRPLVVGVFKDQDIETVNEIADETGIDDHTRTFFFRHLGAFFHQPRGSPAQRLKEMLPLQGVNANIVQPAVVGFTDNGID